jgi:HNH endonuclease
MVNLYVAITDLDWYRYLAGRPDLREINFWKPRGANEFRALVAGELLLFKLHSPLNYIVGGGVFWRAIDLPLQLAWETFGPANGAPDFMTLCKNIGRYGDQTGVRPNRIIKCLVLQELFYFEREDWIRIPDSWNRNIQVGKRYSTETEDGAELWAVASAHLSRKSDYRLNEPPQRYGDPTLIHPRLGQGAFRVGIINAYERRCAITRERTLPALDAAHILPYEEGGEHRLGNGLLLRKDLHALFDKGYLTIDADYTIRVSPSIKKEFENGREYYAFDGQPLVAPMDPSDRPDPSLLSWHNRNRFLA